MVNTDLKHYSVTITPEGGEPHEIGGGVDAPSALGALVQVVELTMIQPETGPVMVLTQDGQIRQLQGFKFGDSSA